MQFYHDIVENLDGAYNRGHKQTDLIIMDFAKSFDKVPHRRLLYKLRYYGIRGATLEWITSWLSGRSQINGVRWICLRSSSCPFWFPSGICPRTGPIFDLPK